jgi:hypothetical protein
MQVCTVYGKHPKHPLIELFAVRYLSLLGGASLLAAKPLPQLEAEELISRMMPAEDVDESLAKTNIQQLVSGELCRSVWSIPAAAKQQSALFRAGLSALLLVDCSPRFSLAVLPDGADWQLRRMIDLFSGTGAVSNLLPTIFAGAPPSQQEQIKLSVLRWLIDDQVAVPDNQLFQLTLLIASCHPNVNIGDQASHYLKYHPVDRENPAFIGLLCDTFLGRFRLDATAAAVMFVPSQDLKTKILQQFERSAPAANRFPENLQLCLDGLFQSQYNLKLQQAAANFLQWIIRIADDSAVLETLAPLAFSALCQFIRHPHPQESTLSSSNQQLWFRLLGTCYVMVGTLARKRPHLVADDLALLQQIMGQDLVNRPSALQSDIYECLLLMMDAFAQSYPRHLLALRSLLFHCISSDGVTCVSI